MRRIEPLVLWLKDVGVNAFTYTIVLKSLPQNYCWDAAYETFVRDDKALEPSNGLRLRTKGLGELKPNPYQLTQ